jgi:hypothetical protein
MKRAGYFLLIVLCTASLAGAALQSTPGALMPLEAKLIPQWPPAVELHWIMFPTFAATQSKVYRSVDDSAHFNELAVTRGSTYTDWDVTQGHTYFYLVVEQQGAFKSNVAWVSIHPHPGRVTGMIEGTVVDSLTGSPIPFARLSFFRPSSPILWLPQVRADSIGRYKAVLDTGTYFILCQSPWWMEISMSPLPPYRQEWYKDAFAPSGATPVPVKAGSVSRIDFDLVRFALPLRAHIRGVVRDSSGNPLRGATVAIQSSVQSMIELSATGGVNTDLPGESMAFDGLGVLRGVVWKGETDSSGRYEATVVLGRAYVAMAAKAGYIPQFYDHKSNPVEATIIRVNGDVENVDFDLNPFRPPHLYSISGVVQDSTGTLVQSRIIVFPLRPRPSNTGVRFGHTDSFGAYTVPRLLPGKYLVLAVPFGRYAPAFYKKGAFGMIRWKEADTVAVSGDVSGIDIGVVRIHCTGVARLTGVVRSGGQPLGGVNILALNTGGAVVGYGLTDDAGAYAIDDLAAGTLTLIADREGYTSVDQQVNVGPSEYAVTRDFTIGSTTSAGGQESAPNEFALRQNYPNPFNPSTRISFSLPVASTVTVKVFNLLGQEIATLINGAFPAGEQVAVWNGTDAAGRGVASGVYFYRLEASGVNGGENYSAMRKMLLLK